MSNKNYCNKSTMHNQDYHGAYERAKDSKTAREESENDTELASAVPKNMEMCFEEENAKSLIGAKGVVVDCELLNVRQGPISENNIIVKIKPGDTVTILDDHNPIFYLVLLDNGTEGYCMKKYISVEEEE